MTDSVIIETEESSIKDESAIEELEKMQKLLNSVKPSGLESTAGIADEMPKQPELFVKNYGYIPLPLLERSAEELLKLSKQASFDIVGESYQFESNEFEVRNPKWNEGLKGLVDRVGIALGWQGAIEPKLHKMLLYKKGGHFKKHHETEKEENMFGMLVLQLPSTFEGGELVFYHRNGASQTYKFGNDCDSRTNFVAYYADLEHELLEVKSGYRLTLIYSLCWIGYNMMKEEKDTISPILAQCLSSLNDGSSKYGVLLKHNYTKSSLKTNSFKALKGIDNDHFTMLSRANSMLPEEKQFDFFTIYGNMRIVWNDNDYDYQRDKYGILGIFKQDKKRPRLETIISSSTQSRDDDVDEDNESEDNSSDSTIYSDSVDEYLEQTVSWELSYQTLSFEVYGLNGFVDKSKFDSKSFKKLINPNDVNQPFADLEDEKNWGGKRVSLEGFERWTWDGPRKYVTYNKCLLAFWPRRINFKAQMQFTSLETLVNMVKIGGNDAENNLEALIDYLDKFKTNSWEKNYLKSELIEQMFALCQKFNRLDLVDKILSHLSPPSVDQMKSLVEKFTWTRVEKSLASFLQPVTMKNIEANCQLTTALSKESQGSAFACFHFAVAPILEDPEQFKIRDSKYFLGLNDSELSSRFDLMAKTIFQFPDDVKASHLEKLFDCLNGLKQEFLKKIIDRIVESFDKEQLPWFMRLFQTRLKFLEENIKEDPVFSWKMPGSIDGHLKLDEFLRSETQTSIVYKREFNGIAEARSFQSNYNGLKNGFSLNIPTTAGCGKNASVTIEKTRAYYENQVKTIAEYRSEYARLKALLNLSEI